MSAARRRLLPSFALGLCAGVGYFGLLDAMIRVRHAVAVSLAVVRHVAYHPIAICDCGNAPGPRTKPVLEKPRLPPEMPPLTVAPMYCEPSEELVPMFNSIDDPTRFDSGSVVPLG